MRSLAYVALACALTACSSVNQPSCDALWQTQEKLSDVSTQLFTNDQIPDEAEPIPGFVVSSLRNSAGEKWVPTTLAQSNCHLQRVLPVYISNAIRDGARKAAASRSTDPDQDELMALVESIDAEIGAALKPFGSELRWGHLTLLIFMESEYEFELWGGRPRPPLQQAIAHRGICNVNLQIRYVLLSYVAFLGVKEYDPKRLRSSFVGVDCD